jgi:predicted secreted protein
MGGDWPIRLLITAVFRLHMISVSLACPLLVITDDYPDRPNSNRVKKDRYMKLLTYWALGTSFIILLTACSSTPSEPKIVRVDEKNNHTTIEVKVGNQLEINLFGNPTTGYTWMITQVDNNILVSSGDPVFEEQSDALGAGGRFTYRFFALTSGETQFKMEYRNPSESITTTAADEYEMMVKVKK